MTIFLIIIITIGAFATSILNLKVHEKLGEYKDFYKNKIKPNEHLKSVTSIITNYIYKGLNHHKKLLTPISFGLWIFLCLLCYILGTEM